jgi:regulatory protein
LLSRVERADRQIEAGESLSGSDGARNPHRDRERSPAFFFSLHALPLVRLPHPQDSVARWARTPAHCASASAQEGEREHLWRAAASVAERFHTGGLMPVITGIVPAPRPAGRFAVLVDGRERAILTLEAIERLRLVVGKAVDGLEDQIELERMRLHAYDRALNMLAFRARSSSELARSLQRKGEERPHVDWALARLKEQGLLDDAAFARSFARSKVVDGKQSRRRVQQDLARKGVSRSLSDEAIDTVFEEEAVDQRAIVEEAARKKLRSLSGLEPAVRRRRLYGFLARRGYDLDDIRSVLSEVDASLDADADVTMDDDQADGEESAG